MGIVTAEEFEARKDLVPVPAEATERVPKHWRQVGESADGRFVYYEGTAIERKAEVD